MLTSDVENFPGYHKPVPGPLLMNDLRSQAESQGAQVLERNVEGLDLETWPFRVTIDGDSGANNRFAAKAIIVCTGAQALWLDAPGEDAVKGKGCVAHSRPFSFPFLIFASDALKCFNVRHVRWRLLPQPGGGCGGRWRRSDGGGGVPHTLRLQGDPRAPQGLVRQGEQDYGREGGRAPARSLQDQPPRQAVGG
jgi:hypothetical protein